MRHILATLLFGFGFQISTALVCHTCAHINSPSTGDYDYSCFYRDKWRQNQCLETEEECAAIFVWDRHQNAVVVRTCLSLALKELRNQCAYFSGYEHELSAKLFFKGLFNESDAIAIKLCTCTWDTCEISISNKGTWDYTNATVESLKILHNVYLTVDMEATTKMHETSTSPETTTELSYTDVVDITTDNNLESNSVAFESENTTEPVTEIMHHNVEAHYMKNSTSIDLQKRTGKVSFNFQVIAATSSSVIFITVIILAFIFRKRSKLQQTIESELEKISNENVDASGTNENELEFNKEYDNESFKIDNTKQLQCSDYTVMFKGNILQNGNITTVAAKVPLKSHFSKSTLTSVNMLVQEMKILSHLGTHKNLIHFYGCNTEILKLGWACIFLEFCAIGPLDNHLQLLRPHIHHDILKVSVLKELLKWTKEIADGMEFVASKHVVHSDLRVKNIFINTQNTAKIANFGYAKRFETNDNNSKLTHLNWRWMAPESLKTWTFSEESDVWSFGVTLWEMFTLGDQPYSGINWPSNFATQLKRGLQLEKPELMKRDIHLIMLKCLHSDPVKRPLFTEILQFLKSVK